MITDVSVNEITSYFCCLHEVDVTMSPCPSLVLLKALTVGFPPLIKQNSVRNQTVNLHWFPPSYV